MAGRCEQDGDCQMISRSGLALACVTALSLGLMCRCRPPSCEEIAEPRVLAAPLNQLTPDTLPDWVESSFHLSEPITVFSVNQYVWKEGERRYDVVLSPNIKRIKVDLAPQPSLNEVLACLGSPALYYATSHLHSDVALEVGLWYPDRNVVVEHFVLSRGLRLIPYTPYIDGQIRMQRLTVVRPGTVNEMIDNAIPYGNMAELHDKVVKSLKPWPGEVSKMEIDP